MLGGFSLCGETVIENAYNLWCGAGYPQLNDEAAGIVQQMAAEARAWRNTAATPHTDEIDIQRFSFIELMQAYQMLRDFDSLDILMRLEPNPVVLEPRNVDFIRELNIEEGLELLPASCAISTDFAQRHIDAWKDEPDYRQIAINSIRRSLSSLENQQVARAVVELAASRFGASVFEPPPPTVNRYIFC